MKRPSVFVYENSIVNRDGWTKCKGQTSRNLRHIPYSQNIHPGSCEWDASKKHPIADLFFAVVPILAPPFVSGTKASMTSAIEQQCYEMRTTITIACYSSS